MSCGLNDCSTLGSSSILRRQCGEVPAEQVDFCKHRSAGQTLQEPLAFFPTKYHVLLENHTMRELVVRNASSWEWCYEALTTNRLWLRVINWTSYNREQAIPRFLIESQRPRQTKRWVFAGVRSGRDHRHQSDGGTDPQCFVAYREEDGQLSKLGDVLCSS